MIFQSTQSSQTVTIIPGLPPISDIFQSTQSSQTVTYTRSSTSCALPISIHTVLADCDTTLAFSDIHFYISIHTVLADCDHSNWFNIFKIYRFQSTQSSQTVTFRGKSQHWWRLISIHTVLADCDVHCGCYFSSFGHFNPHSPRRLWLQLCMIFTIKYNLPSYTMHKSLFILYYIFSRNQILCALFWCESPRHFMFAWDSHHNTCIPFFW